MRGLPSLGTSQPCIYRIRVDTSLEATMFHLKLHLRNIDMLESVLDEFESQEFASSLTNLLKHLLLVARASILILLFILWSALNAPCICSSLTAR